jgi:hypothetical protein
MTYVPDQGVLVVGGQTALLDRESETDTVVGTYVELVVAQRAVRPSSRDDLRDWELAELANLLNLPPAELDALIDRELDRLLGRVNETDHAGTAPGERRRRRLIAATVLAVAAAAAVSAAAASGQSGTPASPPPAQPTVEVVQLPDGSTATRTESPAAPPGDGVDVGTAVQFER